MTERVVGLSGKTLQVATMDDINNGLQLATDSSPGVVAVGMHMFMDKNGAITPVMATTTELGMVRVGENLQVTIAGTLYVPDADTSNKGVVKQMPLTPSITSAPTADDFNSLLSAMKNAGIMSSYLG